MASCRLAIYAERASAMANPSNQPSRLHRLVVQRSRGAGLLMAVLFAMQCQSAEGFFGFGNKQEENDKKLFESVVAGDAQSVEALLAAGAKPDAHVSDNGSCALIQASEDGHTSIVIMLLEKGAKADWQRERDGATALMGASNNGHVDCVHVLLDKGAKPNVLDHNLASALMFACESGNPYIVNLLLQAGADPDLQDKDGVTALMRCSYYAHVDAVHALIDAHARVDLTDKDGLSALGLTELDPTGGWASSQEQQEAAAQLIHFYRNGVEEQSGPEPKSEL